MVVWCVMGCTARILHFHVTRWVRCVFVFICGLVITLTLQINSLIIIHSATFWTGQARGHRRLPFPPPPDKFLDMQLALNPTAPCKQSIKKTVETMHRGQNLFQHAIYIQTRRHRFKTCTPLRDDLYDLCRTDDIFPLQFTL